MIDYLTGYKGKEPQKSVSFMPKRFLDLMANEVARGVRVTAKSLEYIQFKVPRKSGTFQADLFPPCRSPEAALKFEEWWGGVDKEPLRMELKPDLTHQEAAHAKRKNSFLTKLTGKEAPVEQAKPVQSDASDEIKALKLQIEDLCDQL